MPLPLALQRTMSTREIPNEQSTNDRTIHKYIELQEHFMNWNCLDNDSQPGLRALQLVLNPFVYGRTYFQPCVKILLIWPLPEGTVSIELKSFFGWKCHQQILCISLLLARGSTNTQKGFKNGRNIKIMATPGVLYMMRCVFVAVFVSSLVPGVFPAPR